MTNDQPDIVIVRDINYTGEISIGEYIADCDRYRMEDGDEYTMEQLEDQYNPVFCYRQKPDFASRE